MKYDELPVSFRAKYNEVKSRIYPYLASVLEKHLRWSADLEEFRMLADNEFRWIIRQSNIVLNDLCSDKYQQQQRR